ncbi:MAG: hypothetical protein KatS3mg005_3828 [Bryobacteraceae bacterium]|nr:MAG: hypothetical protein KatS3mg005_3828 [Bryobacteraceae bacterium]
MRGSPAPVQKTPASEFLSVAAPQPLRRSPPGDHPLQRPRHSPAADARARFDPRTLPRVPVQHRQNADPPAASHRSPPPTLRSPPATATPPAPAALPPSAGRPRSSALEVYRLRLMHCSSPLCIQGLSEFSLAEFSGIGSTASKAATGQRYARGRSGRSERHAVRRALRQILTGGNGDNPPGPTPPLSGAAPSPSAAPTHGIAGPGAGVGDLA